MSNILLLEVMKLQVKLLRLEKKLLKKAMNGMLEIKLLLESLFLVEAVKNVSVEKNNLVKVSMNRKDCQDNLIWGLAV